MPDEPFGSFLGKKLKVIKFTKEGGIEVPVRANEQDGIAFGVDAIAESEREDHMSSQGSPTGSAPTRRGLRRLFRRS